MALIFPAPAQIKNLLAPTDNTDAATKYYVDTALTGGTIDIQVGNVSVTSNVNANIVTSNTITSIGNLSAGNIIGANLISGNYFSGNGSLLTSINGANVSGTVPNANYASYAGNITISAQSNITSLGTLTGLTSNGVVNFTNTSNVTLGNISNIHISGGSSGYVLQTDGAGNLSWSSVGSSSGNANIGGSNTQIFFNDNGSNTLGTSANLTFNSSTKTLTVDKISGNGSLLSSITGGNVTGYVAFATSADSATVAGTVTTNAQPNITSVGTLTGLTVSGSVNLGSVANVKISGGSSNYILKTDGAGNLSWYNPTYTTVTADDFTGDGTNVAFQLSTTPVNANYTIVSVGGVVQPKTTYTVTGANITFSSAPPSTAPIEVTTINTGITAVSGGSGSGALTWNIASSNATMSANNGYFVDTSNGPKTMTLPTSATLGDTIRINDLAGSFSTNNLTVARNGHKIQGVAQDLLVDTDQSSFGLVYSNSTYGWKVLEL